MKNNLHTSKNSVNTQIFNQQNNMFSQRYRLPPIGSLYLFFTSIYITE